MKGLKLRQIADNVHGTVYVSELESKLMSTAFFIDFMMSIKVPRYI